MTDTPAQYTNHNDFNSGAPQPGNSGSGDNRTTQDLQTPNPNQSSPVADTVNSNLTQAPSNGSQQAPTIQAQNTPDNLVAQKIQTIAQPASFNNYSGGIRLSQPGILGLQEQPKQPEQKIETQIESQKGETEQSPEKTVEILKNTERIESEPPPTVEKETDTNTIPALQDAPNEPVSNVVDMRTGEEPLTRVDDDADKLTVKADLEEQDYIRHVEEAHRNEQ